MEDSAENFPLTVEALIELYLPVKPQIEARLMDFRHIWETASDEDIFRELVFCLLTPQSKAKTCWKAVQRLERKCMIAEAVPAAITEELVGVRFNQRKAEYICLARSQFAAQSLRKTLADFAGPAAAREWLVENVKGGSWAELGSLAEGDLIVEVDGRPVDKVDALRRELERVAASKEKVVVLKVLRGIHTCYLEIEPNWKN